MIRYDLSASDYHAHPAISKSRLDLLAKSPAHFRAYLDGELERTETPAMKLGTALHCAVLEPERFALEYVAAPDFGDGRTKAAKDAKAAFEAEHAGKFVLSAGEYASIVGMSLSVSRHRGASNLLARSLVREPSVFWTDAETGIECRARPDALSEDGSLVVDLKTTRDASPRAFAKSIGEYRYHVQDAIYSDGIAAATSKRPEAFAFIAVESAAPYLCASYVLDDASRLAGRYAYRRDLDTLRACRDSGKWPGYSEKIEMISAPFWADGMTGND